MEKPKRTKVITVRITPETESVIMAIADKYKWTPSHTVNIILEQFCHDQKEIRL